MFDGTTPLWLMVAIVAAAVIGGVTWRRHQRNLEKRHTDVFVSRLRQPMQAGDDD